MIAGERRAPVLEQEDKPAIGQVLSAQKPWVAPIPGTTKSHRLEENLGAAAVELTPEDLRDIERTVSGVTVEGDRYPAQMQALVNR